jgi:hypothetical protein
MTDPKKKSIIPRLIMGLAGLVVFAGLGGLAYLKLSSSETQNRFARTLQNWTGANGTLDIYAGDKLVQRFIKINKLTTGAGTNSGEARPYRYGFGTWDKNFNYVKDPDEPTVYFEISDYNGNYIFYQTE